MPKKFHGENSKAVEARARKNAVETEKRLKKEKEEEDKLWEDNDKHILRKEERKVNQNTLFGPGVYTFMPPFIG